METEFQMLMERKREMEQRGPSTEIDRRKERYLFLGSIRDFFCIDLEETEKKHGLSCQFLLDEGAVPEAVIAWESTIRDHDPPLPLGAGSTSYRFKNPDFSVTSFASVLDTEWDFTYIIGGEKLDSQCRGGDFDKTYQVISKPSSDGKISVSFEEDPSIPAMNFGKGNPIVEVIEGKLYLLHTGYISRQNSVVPERPFEVFDDGKWMPLNSPDFFDRKLGEFGGLISSHIVLDHRLVVLTTVGSIHSFDTRTNIWSNSDSDSVSQDLMMCFPLRVCFDYFGQIDGNRLSVGIRLVGDEPVAFLVNSKGEIVGSQELPQIFKGLRPSFPRYPIYDDASVLIPMKSNEVDVVRMCACAIISISASGGSGTVLAISIFKMVINQTARRLIINQQMLEKPPPSNDANSNFVHVDVERSFVLQVNGITHGLYLLNGPAFFL